MAIRVREAARILGVSGSSVRQWTNNGLLPDIRNAANQRIYERETLESFLRERRGEEPPAAITVFYVRSSNRNDILLETQTEKLTAAFGEPDLVFSDSSSGLRENRVGLRRLREEIKKPGRYVVHVTNKDRLSRFGVSYLEELFKLCDTELVVLDSDDCKEPHEVLLQDFMSLLASFSGKFYRLRGWEQRRKFLNTVAEEVEREANA